jgi:hypothetical protein
MQKLSKQKLISLNIIYTVEKHEPILFPRESREMYEAWGWDEAKFNRVYANWKKQRGYK